MGRKSKAKSKVEQRPNPYSSMGDAELESEYSAAISAFIERLMYFATLPEWMSEEFKSIHEKGPAAYGLSTGEWRQYCIDRWEHIVEGAKLGDINAERHRRLQEAARAAVASCPDMDAADALCESYRRDDALACQHLLDGEDVRAYVMRQEKWWDGLFESFGAMSGSWELSCRLDWS
ncbi:MAG: hypothetical protein IJI35_14660 [Kiritimatiellae bacterium]|nr:hypothetical protein [Eggerthellaceae bacterium]MBQ6330258.1 hypothetical protein [Kiritimatiellia bacterium]